MNKVQMEENHPTTMPSFQDLDFVHEALLEEYHKHQDAVVERDLSLARAHLDQFVLALKAHIRAEEEILLPIYVERVPEQVGCSPELLFSEHRKMERLLRRLQDRMIQMEQQGELSAREVVYIIEEGRMMKEVLDHHDRRERAAFFPLLNDAVPDPVERREIWEEARAIQLEAEGLRATFERLDDLA